MRMSEAQAGKMKYSNKKTVADGLAFDSKKEARRYQVLALYQRQGMISNLQQQVSFVLAEGVRFASEPRKKPAIRYVADFVYTDAKTGQMIVEDVKSAVTRKLPAYRIKKHLMMSVHGIEIREV